MKKVESLKEFKIKNKKQNQSELDYNYKIMQFMGELVAGADHEINNLIMMIEGSSRIIVDDSSKTDHKQLALEGITTKTKKIKEIMSDLRAVLKDGSKDQIRSYHIKDIINKSISLCRTRFKNHRIFFQLNISDDLKIEGKETQLIQSLLAVLTSSHDAIVHHQERWIKVSVNEDSNEVSINIQDSGNPLNDIDKSKLFMPFYETADGRTGIGLSMAKGIIEAHKGHVFIENTKDNVPQIKISLPKLQPSANHAKIKSNIIYEEVEIYDHNIVRKKAA